MDRSKLLSKIQPFLPILLLATFFIGTSFSFWPGVLSPDAYTQYVAAKHAFYNDHHPPLMSFLWHYLDLIFPNPAVMFMLHLCILYAAVAIFMRMFKDSKMKWWYAFYPIIPNLLAYTALIVKDTGFTFTYLLCGAILSYLIVYRVRKHLNLILAGVCLLLFYGTAVKFQAKFILIYFTLAIAYCYYGYKLNRRSIIGGAFLFAAILLAIMNANAKLVPRSQEDHSWQFVKIYDLTAISMALDKELYPEFILKQPSYDFERIKSEFNPQEVDSVAFGENPIIYKSKIATERDILWQYWFNTIKQHPVEYLKARLKLFSYNLTTSPCDRSNPVKFMSRTTMAPLLELPGISETISAGYSLFKALLRFMWLVPVVFIYIILAIRNFKQSFAAPALLLLSISSLTLMTVLLFFSMAATARYVFLCTCFMHASHGLALLTWRDMRRARQEFSPINFLHINRI